ncbi:MAG: hypothetical protein Q7S12_03910 [bacterium]|nr:hypothetical protein [bacterium]
MNRQDKLYDEVGFMKRKIDLKRDGKRLFDACIKLAKKSDCDKRKFGSLVVSKQLIMLSTFEPRKLTPGVRGLGYNHIIRGLENFNCCKERASIASGTRTEYCGAIHAEMMALQYALPNHFLGDNEPEIVFVAGLNGDGSFFNNSGGFYCLPCAKELAHAGIKKIALASADTPKSGEWVYVTIEEALQQSLEFTKGTKKVDYDAGFGR